MTAVLNYLIIALIGVSVLVAIVFILKAIQSRSQSARETYGVGQQEARRSMQIDLVRGVAFFVVGLILLGVYGLSFRPTEAVSEPTAPPAPATPAATATTTHASPTTTNPPQEPTREPTDPPPTATATPVPEPTEGSLNTAVVISEVGVWLRGSPGTSGEQLEWVLGGTELTLLPGRETADTFTWQQVSTPDGNEGWVATEFIEEN